MAEITEKIIEIKAKVEGETTVKELKEQVAELSSLMNTLDKESEEYKDTVNLLVSAEEKLNNMMKVGKSQLSAQEGSYNALVNRMTALKKAHKAVNDEATRSRLSDEINKINEELKEMDAKNGVYVRNVGNYENAVKKALKTPQQELKALRLELAQLEEGTAEYNAVFTRMAQLTHDVTEQQEQLKWSSADLGDILGNVAGVATSIAGGFSAFNALSGLMGGESEELDKAMVQAQRFIQLIQGLEQLEQLGDKISGLWKGIKNFSNNSAAAAVSLADFNSKTKASESAMQGATQATSASAAVTGQAAKATENLATAGKELNQVEIEYTENQSILLQLEQEILAQEEAELVILQERARLEDSTNKELERKIADTQKEIDYHKQKIATIQGNITATKTNTTATQANTTATTANTSANATNTTATNTNTTATQANTTATQANTAATELNHKGLKGRLATMILNSKQNKLNAEKLNALTAELNGMTTAQLVGKAATLGLSAAWGVLKTALISSGIGVIIVALGALLSLLGKGAGKLWDWVTGANKAKEQTENLQNSFNALNERLEEQEKSWERQERLMKAQGKSYDEIYQARKKNLQSQLAEVQAELALQQAIANDIGQRKLQKEKYDEFRKTLEELTEKEEQLKQAIEGLDYDNYIKGVEDETKAEQERIKAKEDAAKAAVEAHKKEKESADKLYKDLQEHYKDEQTKLKEKYEEEKKLLEKFGKDTTLLTKKYEEDKTAIVLKEEEARKKLRDQYNKDFDASFRSGSLEALENELANATDKLEDFKVVNDLIVKDENGMHSLSGYADEIKYLQEEYGVTIQSMSHFLLIFEKVKHEYEDAEKALNEFKSNERVKEIEKEFEAINNVMELETEKKQIEYDLYASQGTWYNGFTNNYITQMKLRWETEDGIFQLRKAKIQEEIELYRKAKDDENLTEEARINAKKKLAELEQQLALETADYTIAQNQRKAEASDNYVAAVQDSLDGISSILGTVADAWETSIKAEVDAGRMSEEEGERKMDNMRGIQSAIALINAFSSAVSSYNSMASIPFVGPALGAAAAAAAIASGLAQVKAINAVKKGDTGGGGSDSTRYAEVTPTVPNDYNPQAVTNVTGGQETENLANALTNASIWVSVRDIDSAQSKVKTRDKETSF